MANSHPHPIERVARPFIAKLLKAAAENGDSPGDYFLLLPKYTPNEAMIVPRSLAGQVLESAKSEARRRKYERLIASPCDAHDLLVLVCAGDHVEGHWMKVPALLGRTEAPSEELSSESLPADVHHYMRLHFGGIARAIRQAKGIIGEWAAVLRLPSEVPIVLRRSVLRAQLAKAGSDEEVLRELDKPGADRELFCVYATRGKLFWFRQASSMTVEPGETMHGFAERLLHECTKQLQEFDQDPKDHLAWFQWPATEDGGIDPIVCPRIQVDQELKELEAGQKLAQIKKLLAEPGDGLKVFIDVEGQENLVVVTDEADFVAERNRILTEAIEKIRLEALRSGGAGSSGTDA